MLIFTDYWLEPYQDPNDPNSTLYINFTDFAPFAANWLKRQGVTDIPFFFDKEPNNVGGVLTISVDLVLSNIHQAWLLMDGQIVSGLNATDEEFSETIINTNQYRNGEHEFKIVGLREGRFVALPPTACTFNNKLSSVTQSKGFEPGRDYYLYAVTEPNDTNSYSIELYDIVNEETTFSTECQNGLTVCIPSAAFTEEYGIYDLNITKQQEGQMMLLLSDEDKINNVITRKFDPSDPRNPYYRMVISIGSKDLQTAKEQCWKAVVRAAVKRNIYPIVLKYEDCTWDNLSYCLRLDRVRMWYHLSHGGHKALMTTRDRSCIEVNGGLVFSYLKKDYPTVPSDYESLPWWYENNPSIAELGFQGSPKMIWVQFNSCSSARTMEFAAMLGILPIKDPFFIGDQVFIGWKNSAKVYDMVEQYNTYERRFWGYLQDDSTLRDAHEDAVFGLRGELTIRENFCYYGVIDYQLIRFRYRN